MSSPLLPPRFVLPVWLVALAACGTPLRPPPGTGWARVTPEPRPPVEAADGSVLVHYPAGACATGWLELEIFVRGGDGDGWVAHPAGSRVATGSCRFEPAGRLLNETRVRCVDPSGRRAPSPWVTGVVIEPSSSREACAGS